MERTEHRHTGDLFGWAGFWIALGLVISVLIWQEHIDDRTDSLNRYRDLSSRRDVCERMAIDYESQVTYDVDNFNFCVNNIQ